MKVAFEGNEYTFDLNDVTLRQASTIYGKTHLTLIDLIDALKEAQPDALRAAYWLMLDQSGVKANFDTVDFAIFAFIEALENSAENEKPGTADGEEDPKAQ